VGSRVILTKVVAEKRFHPLLLRYWTAPFPTCTYINHSSQYVSLSFYTKILTFGVVSSNIPNINKTKLWEFVIRSSGFRYPWGYMQGSGCEVHWYLRFFKGWYEICGEVGERLVTLRRQLAGSSRLAARWSGIADRNDGCVSPPADCSL